MAMKKAEIELIKEFMGEISSYIVDMYKKKEEVTVSTKKDETDFLTEVDLFVQKSFVKRVKAEFPDDIVVGEEAGLSNYPENYEGRAWIIDPIDGTANFVRSYFPAFVVAVAFANKRELLSSGVLVPITGDMFFAEKGSGAFGNGNRMQVSKKERLSESCIHLDFGKRSLRKERLLYFIEPLLTVGQVRCMGSAILSLVQVSLGIADGYVHASLRPWDYASGQLILEEAGGKITQTDGSPLQLFGDNKGIIASNGYIHEELLQVINKSLEKYEELRRI